LDGIPVVNDLHFVGGVVSGVGNLADDVLDAVGSILNLPLSIVAGISGRLDRREWIIVEHALARTMKTFVLMLFRLLVRSTRMDLA
jgi:hypothetical protein